MLFLVSYVCVVLKGNELLRLSFKNSVFVFKQSKWWY